jgi:predicted Zn finger-like uncharacterized protein
MSLRCAGTNRGERASGLENNRKLPYSRIEDPAIPRVEQTMILKCSYCGRKMSVDDERIPAGRAVKVRCPHCKGIGLTSRSPKEAGASGKPEALQRMEPAKEAPVRQPGAPGPAGGAASPLESAASSYDASGEFLFPAERETASLKERRPGGTAKRIVLWVAASILVVCAFALLVNVILPGPVR